MAAYTIRGGDTLTSIAAKLSGVKGSAVYGYVNALVTINNIVDPNVIQTGQVLNYPNEWANTNINVGAGNTVNANANAGNVFNIKRVLTKPMILAVAALGVYLYFNRDK